MAVVDELGPESSKKSRDFKFFAGVYPKNLTK
jgi:hypothetical protein